MESKLLEIVATSINKSPFVWLGWALQKPRRKYLCVFGVATTVCTFLFILVLP